MVLLLPSLSLHLLHLNGIRLSPPHVQLMVTHTQCQDALVDAQSRCIKHKVLKKNRCRKYTLYYKAKSQISVDLFYTSDEFDTHRCFLVNGFDDKLLVIERDVSNLTPREANLWCQPEKKTAVVNNVHCKLFTS